MVCCICWIKAGRLFAFTLDLNTIQMSEATVTATGKKESGGSSAGHNNATISSRKESILELTKMMDAEVRVKCLGGRELQGILRGFDDLVNLVLDDCIEYIRDPETHLATDRTRKLGLAVVRGTQVSLVSPQEGVEEIANPFLAADEEDDD